MAKPNNDFWLIAPYGWGSEENMIRVQKDQASTALKAISHAEKAGAYSPEGFTLAEELANHWVETVFVYDCKEVGAYEKMSWRKVEG